MEIQRWKDFCDDLNDTPKSFAESFVLSKKHGRFVFWKSLLELNNTVVDEGEKHIDFEVQTGCIIGITCS
jgi:hypothetical protein